MPMYSACFSTKMLVAKLAQKSNFCLAKSDAGASAGIFPGRGKNFGDIIKHRHSKAYTMYSNIVCWKCQRNKCGFTNSQEQITIVQQFHQYSQTNQWRHCIKIEKTI